MYNSYSTVINLMEQFTGAVGQLISASISVARPVYGVRPQCWADVVN